jgi:hypothetical protein
LIFISKSSGWEYIENVGQGQKETFFVNNFPGKASDGMVFKSG